MPLSKKLFRTGPYADFFSEGVQVGQTLYLAGQVSVDENGRAPDDLVEQTPLPKLKLKLMCGYDVCP